jgi:hypothetical protein
MTSEVLIMNEECVAIAADSIVTVGSKTYKTDKIFSLSDTQPIGIMIYGDASISDVPASIIIKEYRAQLGDKRFRTIDECVNDFLKFVENGGSDSFESNPLITRERIDRSVSRYAIELTGVLSSNLKEELEKSDEDRAVLMGRIIEQLITGLEEGLDRDAAAATLLRLRGNENAVSILSRLEYCNDVDRLLLLLSYFLASTSTDKIGDRTGIVITGYGTDDIYPSFKEVVINGLLYNGLKYTVESSEKIGFEIRSWIEAFAQKDVVETYLHGISPEIRENVFSEVEYMLGVATDAVLNTLGVDSAGIRDNVKSVVDDMVESYRGRMYDYMLQNYFLPTEDAVMFLSKDEMASMAESLVNFTSLKRHVSDDFESVGGPVDVAVISKSEGMIWIKRKHYFDLVLNPSYVERRRRREE